MITESLIRFETLAENPDRLFAANYAEESFFLETHSDSYPNHACYWRTAAGISVAEKIKPENAKSELIAFLNRRFSTSQR